MVSEPWACLGIQCLWIGLGCHTVKDGEEETQQDRRAKIGQVYGQLGALTQLLHLELGCDILSGPYDVGLDF